CGAKIKSAAANSAALATAAGWCREGGQALPILQAFGTARLNGVPRANDRTGSANSQGGRLHPQAMGPDRPAPRHYGQGQTTSFRWPPANRGPTSFRPRGPRGPAP